MRLVLLKRPTVWLSVGIVSGAIAACNSNGTASPDGGSCETPSGQLADWQPTPGAVADGGGFSSSMGGVLGLGDGGPGTMGTMGTVGMADGGSAPPPGDGGSSAGVGTDAVQQDPTGEALTFFYQQTEQATTEPDTLTVLVTAPGVSNGRFCESCHSAESGWQITPAFAAIEFAGNEGFPSNAKATSNDQLDPMFRPVDGATSPADDLSTPAARQSAYALLLGKGLIRVGMPMPQSPDFALTGIDDPYHYASAQELSLFRRPLPMMNIRFLTTLMWDGRFTQRCESMLSDLTAQANNAALTHEEAAQGPSQGTLQLITDRERIIYFAQSLDNAAGALDADGALGGPQNLQKQPFYFGANAFPGPDPKGVAYTSQAFALFDAWASLSGSDAQTAARVAIARGQAVFNSRTFSIANVKGFNDDLGLESVQGTCTTCHNTPNVGNNSVGLLMDIGVSDASRRTPDLPLYTLKRTSTGETVQVTDPGMALVTGKWNDIGRFKVPTLRGLAFRAPYFHDGSGATLMDVVNFTDSRFSIALTDSEKSDLVAFLDAL